LSCSVGRAKEEVEHVLRRIGLITIALALTTSGCIFGGGGQTRTVLVDYSSDQFASSYDGFFPRHVQVHPGDAVVFKQTWTGEPHTVTGGTLIDPLEKAIAPYIPKYDTGGFNALGVGDEPKNVKDAAANVPSMFDEKTQQIAQNGAQPCYLETGKPPTNPQTPCAKRAAPAFSGRQSFYSSGYIHYAGPSGNIFRMPIAKDATPGRYYFFCVVHGPLMSTYVDIKPKSERIPSQAEVTDAASKKINFWTQPLSRAWTTANAGEVVPPPENKELAGPGSKYFKGTFAGFGALPDEKLQLSEGINEFIPRKTTAKVGAPVTWTTFGGHTISFDVPKYFPIVTVQKDGKVVRNPQLEKPAGGSPALGPPSDKPAKIDAGTWNGDHFWSSGLIDTGNGNNIYVQYTMRFGKAGTYRYACLVHPAMVADITITP
jgi:plastocyanin